MKMKKIVLLGLTLLLPSLAGATSVEVNTDLQQSSGFQDGTIAPFFPCTLKSPNSAGFARLNGTPCLKCYWQQTGYDGTRMKRGAEACSNLQTFKEGWYGFSFYLPSGGYPKDKTGAIGQIFQFGRCKSWGALLNVENGALHLKYRSNCGNPVDAVITGSIQYDAWNPIIIHFVASHQKTGSMQVWYANACNNQANPTYNAPGINFGFGEWDGDTLAAGNQLTFKIGQYDFEDHNYTAGETRTNYYRNVCQISGNPTDAWKTANPLIP